MSARAELLTHHVFLDLETTGLDPSRDEVIELGALFVENGEVVRRVQRLFRPSVPLPLAIRRITGIKDEELLEAPPFEAFKRELEELLRGWTVVAHNASFEEAFLEETLKRAGAPVLDSCELLHYLYPELDSHSLEAVIRWARAGDKAAHRALKDCEDTCAVLCFALDKFVDEGRLEDVNELLELLDAGDQTPLLALLRSLKSCVKEVRPELLLTKTNAFLPPRPERLRKAVRAEAPEEPVAVTDAEVEAVVGPGGALERAGGFSPRQQQREMAREVAKTFSEGGALAVEAGTGTGKSLGYLAPAALFAVKNGQKVAIATHTKTLQDQLVEKDLPRLHRVLGGSFGFAVLKGQSNYICRRRALEATAVDPRMGHDERAPRAYIRALLRRSQDGDLDKLSYWFREHYPALNGLVQAIRSESATTLGERCPHYRRCYYHSAVSHAKEADLLVVNQALAFAWPGRYPKLDHLIVDEAHEVEDTATTALELELSRSTFLNLFDRLSARSRSGVLSAIRRTLAGTGTGRAAKDVVDELEGRVAHLVQDAEALGEAVAELAGLADGGNGYQREVRLTGEVHASRSWLPVHAALTALQGDVEELRKGLRQRVLDLLPDLAVQKPALDKELSGAEELLAELAAAVEQFGKPPEGARCLFATARRTHSGATDWGLHSQPTDVAGFVASAFAAERKTLILTSATLSTGPETPWVLDRLGLTRGERPARFLSEPTPFDLKSQTLVVLVTDAPDPQSEEFVEWSAGRVSGLAQFLGGRVLGLFASTRRMDEVGTKIRQTLEPLGIEVMRQSRGNGRAMAAKQEQDAGTVLLGTKSFWQGIDIPGRGLSCVFIDKLPLEPQTRPIVAAREERLGSGEGASFQGFMQYRLPRALIQLRQGVGRLIRSPDDRGIVIIADPGSAAYRAKVLAALSGYRVEMLPWARARVRIFEVFKEMGLSAAQPPKVAQSA